MRTLKQFFHQLTKHDGVLIVLSIYVFASITYQAISPIIESRTVITSVSTQCYELKLRLPSRVPLSSGFSKKTIQPISIWGWRSNNIEECYNPFGNVALQLENIGDLIVLDGDGKEIPPTFDINLGKTEENSPHHTFYITYPILINNKPLPEELNAKLILTDSRTISIDHLLLNIQSLFQKFGGNLLDIFLGTPFLTAVAAVFAFWRFHEDRLDKRRRQEKELIFLASQLKDSEPTQLALKGYDLYALSKRLGTDVHIRNRIKEQTLTLQSSHKFRHHWKRGLRLYVLNKLKAKDGDFSIWFKDINDFSNWLTPTEEASILRFCCCLCNIDRDDNGSVCHCDFTDLLDTSLHTFYILSLQATHLIIELIQEKYNDTDLKNAIKEHWFKDGGASGYYLIKQLPNGESWLQEWLDNKAQQPNTVEAPLSLWPRNMPNVIDNKDGLLQSAWKDSWMWHQPFSPLKGEYDPRLPRKPKPDSIIDSRPIAGLFWSGHPIWDKYIRSSESVVIYATKGMGVSTLIWMGRHEYRYWGYSPGLSLYLTLDGKPQKDVFQHLLERSFANALMTSLVEDPFWLLSARRWVQRQITSFLIHTYNNISDIKQLLIDAGLPKPEANLLEDVIYQCIPCQEYDSTDFRSLFELVVSAMTKSAQYRLMFEREFQVNLFIEFDASEAAEGWINIIKDQGYLSLFVLKCFVISNGQHLELDDLLTQVDFKWDNTQLKKMLEYRIQVCWGSVAETNCKKLCEDSLESSADVTPKKLLKEANRLFAKGDIQF